MRHLDETALMMLHYDRDGSRRESQHVESCERCRSAFELLSKGLDADAMHDSDAGSDLPDAFWDRQRTSIFRRAIAEKHRRSAQSVLWRGFVAAMLAVVVVLVISRSHRDVPERSAAVVVRNAAAIPAAAPDTQRVAVIDEVQSSSDPWASDELQSFHDVVQWETWEKSAAPDHKGGTS